MRCNFTACILFMTIANGYSQKLEVINSPRKLSPFVIVLMQPDVSDEMVKKLSKYSDKKETAFLYFEVNELEFDVVKDSLNGFLNSREDIDKQRNYLVIAGDSNFFEMYEGIGDTKFFSSKYYLKSDGDEQLSSEYRSSSLFSTPIQVVVDDLTSHYLWQIRLAEIKRDNVSDINQNKFERGLGFKMSSNIPTVRGIDSKTSDSFRTFSIGTYRRWNKHIQTNFNLDVGLNLPGKKKIQKELKQDIQSNFGGDVDVDLQIHVYLNAGFEGRYLFRQNKNLNPYVGVGLGFFAFSAMDTTISVDTSNILNGGGGFERPDGGFGRSNMELITGRTLSLSSGFQYSLSKKVISDFGIKWSNDFNSFKNSDAYMNNLNIYMGLKFRFSSKKILFYDYVH